MKYFIAFLMFCFLVGFLSWNRKSRWPAVLLLLSSLFIVVAFFFFNKI